MARPLWAVGFTWLAVLAAAALLPLNVTVLLAALCELLFVATLFISPLRKKRALPVVILAAGIAFSLYAVREVFVYRPCVRLDGRTVQVEAQVIETYTNGAVDLRVLEGCEIPKGVGLILFLGDQAEHPDLYERVSGRLTVRAEDLSDLRNLGYKAGGFYLTAVPEEYGGAALRYEAMAPPWTAPFQRAGRLAQGVLMTYLPDDRGGLASLITVGRGSLSEEAQDAFGLSGVSHLIAVSGLHMAILSQAVLSLLKKLRIPRCPAALLTMAGVCGYMALVGFRASVVRAGVLCLVVLLGSCVRRRSDSLNSIGLALILLLAADPYAAYDIGLQLSFAACLGILWLYPFLRERMGRLVTWAAEAGPPEAGEAPAIPLWRRISGRLLGKGLDALSVTLSAMLPTLPLTAFWFGSLSLIAPPANLLTVFPASLLLMTSCLGVVFHALPLLSFLAEPLFLAAGLLADYLLRATRLFASLPFAAVTVRDGYLLLWLPAAFGLLLLGWRLCRGKGVRCAAAAAAIVLFCGLGVRMLSMRGVTTLTVARRTMSAEVLIERDGRAGAVITGNDDGSNLVMLLRERGIRALDFLVVTDGTEGDLARLPHLLEAYIADTVYLYPAGRGPCAAIAPKFRRAYPLENASCTFWGGETLLWRDGFLRMEFGDTRVLFCSGEGDAARLPESWRETHLVLFSEEPPLHAGAIRATSGVMACRADRMPTALKGIPRSDYEIRATQREQSDLALMTRGRGDMTWKS